MVVLGTYRPLLPGVWYVHWREPKFFLWSTVSSNAWRRCPGAANAKWTGSAHPSIYGPPNRADTRFFPTAEYVFVDCTENEDYISASAHSLDRSHQYYRQSISVRADIARVLKALPLPDGARVYNEKGNVNTLPTKVVGV